MIDKRGKMTETNTQNDISTMPLLQLPDIALANVLQNLDAISLCQIERTSRYFRPMVEHTARQRMMDRFAGDEDTATRFKHISWKERLYLEEDTACGFNQEWYEDAGFAFTPPSKNTKAVGVPCISLMGMGPKLLVSDISTADQKVIRWRLRVRGNTAVEFGCIPLGVDVSHTALHKCQPVPGDHEHRCTGFSSQITAGSLLPVKVPVMRGTELDLVARRGLLQVIFHYPLGAKEISWQNGQPVARPYRGPRKLRFEVELPENVDFKLGLTAWAKASFDILQYGTDGLNDSDFGCILESSPLAAATPISAMDANAIRIATPRSLMNIVGDDHLLHGEQDPREVQLEFLSMEPVDALLHAAAAASSATTTTVTTTTLTTSAGARQDGRQTHPFDSIQHGTAHNRREIAEAAAPATQDEDEKGLHASSPTQSLFPASSLDEAGSSVLAEYAALCNTQHNQQQGGFDVSIPPSPDHMPLLSSGSSGSGSGDDDDLALGNGMNLGRRRHHHHLSNECTPYLVDGGHPQNASTKVLFDNN